MLLPASPGLGITFARVAYISLNKAIETVAPAFMSPLLDIGMCTEQHASNHLNLQGILMVPEVKDDRKNNNVRIFVSACATMRAQSRTFSIKCLEDHAANTLMGPLFQTCTPNKASKHVRFKAMQGPRN